MAIESTCVVDQKCLRCHMKPASFFQRVFLVNAVFPLIVLAFGIKSLSLRCKM